MLAAAQMLIREEGIIPALESSHALACAFKEAPFLTPDDVILINLSGRGDKDIFSYGKALGDQSWIDYLKAVSSTEIPEKGSR